MREAHEFVEEYRRKGYPDERVRIIASMRPEPLRSEVLKLLDAGRAGNVAPPASEPAKEKAEPKPETDAEPTSETEAASDEVVAAASQVEDVAAVEDATATADKTRGTESASKASAEKAAAGNAKLQQELKRLRAESVKAKKLAGRVHELDGVREKLDAARKERQALATEKAEIDETLANLKRELEEKCAAVAEKEKKVREVEATLARERAERKIAVSIANELEESLHEKDVSFQAQTDLVAELQPLGKELETANAYVDELRRDAEAMKQSEEARTRRIVELESEAEQVREETTALREQIASNERGIEGLQEKLDVRASELESLREHFDREAKDLEKRAEQESWMIQRRLRRVHRLAGVGAVVAACLIVIAFLAPLFIYRGRLSGLETELASKDKQIQALRAQAQAPRRPGVVREAVQEQRDPDARAPESPGPIRLVVETPLAGTPEATALQATVTYHTVRKNDTLWDISAHYRGHGKYFKEIARENGIEPDARLMPGQRLRITIPAE